jgi:hypothetical protein
VTYLNIVFGKLLCQRLTSKSKRVHSIIDGDLSILMVQPSINVITTLSHDALAKNDRRSGGVDEEVIVWDILSWA